MVEELGDVLFQIIFYGKLGEKAKRFSLEDIITTVSEKLVCTATLMFLEMSRSKMLMKSSITGEKAKVEEKKERKHPLEGIPKTLGALARAQKIVSQDYSHQAFVSSKRAEKYLLKLPLVINF